MQSMVVDIYYKHIFSIDASLLQNKGLLEVLGKTFNDVVLIG
jgi:hypothetical protein